MKSIYATLISTFFFLSCATRIDYIGSTKPSTTEVEVFTSRESIPRPYKEIGKGFIHYGYGGTRNLEKIQKKIVAKAKKQGADAVFIQDYYIRDNGANISSVFKTDSIGKSAVTTGSTTVQQTISSGFNIIFLKYQ